MSKQKPILCLDFDGVIHLYTSGWKGADIVSDPPVPGALEFVYDALDRFEVHIFSSRSNQSGGIAAMKSFLAEGFMQDMRMDSQKVMETVQAIKFPKEKPPAFVTIDDRAIQFNGEFPDLDKLAKFKPWNKKSSKGVMDIHELARRIQAYDRITEYNEEKAKAGAVVITALRKKNAELGQKIYDLEVEKLNK